MAVCLFPKAVARHSRQGQLAPHHLRLFPRPMALTALLLAPEYASSQNSGWPKCLACTLIWWVRPVSRRHCTSAALLPARGLSTL